MSFVTLKKKDRKLKVFSLIGYMACFMGMTRVPKDLRGINLTQRTGLKFEKKKCPRSLS